MKRKVKLLATLALSVSMIFSHISSLPAFAEGVVNKYEEAGFADAVLYSCAVQSYNRENDTHYNPKEDILTAEQVASIRMFMCGPTAYAITSFTDLAKLTNLEDYRHDGSDFLEEELLELAKHPKLETVGLWRTARYSSGIVSPDFTVLKNLKNLYIMSDDEATTSITLNNPKLEILDISGFPNLQSYISLAGHKNLKQLGIHTSNISTSIPPEITPKTTIVDVTDCPSLYALDVSAYSGVLYSVPVVKEIDTEKVFDLSDVSLLKSVSATYEVDGWKSEIIDIDIPSTEYYSYDKATSQLTVKKNIPLENGSVRILAKSTRKKLYGDEDITTVDNYIYIREKYNGKTERTKEKNLSLHIETDFSEWDEDSRIYIDSVEVPAEAYKITEGSVRIDIDGDYLLTLSEEEHIISAQLANGSYYTSFILTESGEIIAPDGSEEDVPLVPDTGLLSIIKSFLSESIIKYIVITLGILATILLAIKMHRSHVLRKLWK